MSSLHGVRGLHSGPPSSQLDAAYDAYRGRIPAWLLPIGDDPLGNEVCLAISGAERGAVYFWDHARGELNRLADAFSVFLASLFEWEDPNESRLRKIARTNDLDAARALVAQRCDLEREDEHGRTLLENAAMWGRLDMVQLLVAAGARVRAARQLAAQNAHGNVVEYLDGLRG